MKTKILVIDDEKILAEMIAESMSEHGFDVDIATRRSDAEDMLYKTTYDMVLSDIHMPDGNGLSLLRDIRTKLSALPVWIFMSGNPSPENFEEGSKLGAVDVLQKPIEFAELAATLKKIKARKVDPLAEIMEIVQSISGVVLGPSKKLVTETRLMRRARALGLASITDYLEFFRDHRDSEVNEIVSLLTTHTTEFFREPDHFDFLSDQVLPNLINGSRPLKVWSAACSSGQELYSLAICISEYLEANGMSLESGPNIEFYGTDIDHESVAKACDGVYDVKQLQECNEELVRKYFDVGSDDLEGFLRIKDFVHERCRFEQMNLLSSSWNLPQFDIIFLRNVLIYFRPQDVEAIAKHMIRHLNSDGYLFLGHSESLSGTSVKISTVGNSVYSQRAQPKKIAAINGVSAADGSVDSTPTTKVFVIDDSATIRAMLKKILAKEHGFEVVGEAVNPIEAERLMVGKKIDVITLDIHMPEMDGITYLEKLKNKPHPPIVMVSSVSYEDAISAMRCFELGAVDYVEKPSHQSLEAEADRIRVILRNVATAKVSSIGKASYRKEVKSVQQLRELSGQEIILIGSSTGGIEALQTVLEQMPETSPPILIVQHIPQNFTKALAKRLNDLCKITVKEAENGEPVNASTAYIAPGGKQMRMKQSGRGLTIEINDDPPINRFKPSVDYLFHAGAEIAKKFEISAAILTGMGSDGAKGMKELCDLGAHTVAQDEATSVVFGMPKEAIRLGGAKETVPLPSIAYHLMKAFSKKSAA